MTPKVMYPPQKDSPSTYLIGDIGTEDVHIFVGSAEVLPQAVPFPLTLGFDKSVTETVIVTEIVSGMNQLIVTRSNTPLAWLAGTKCARVFTEADLKTVQDNLTEIIEQSNTFDESIEENRENIEELARVVGDDSGGIVKGLADEIVRAKEAESAEVTRAQGVEEALSTGKVNRTELPQVIVDWVYTADGTGVEVTITRYNASNQTTSTFTKVIPIVSNASVGLMTPEAYAEITSLRSDVLALQQQGGVFIGVSFATKADLDSYVIPPTTNPGDFTYVLDDEEHSDATTRYIFDGTAFDFAYVINYDPIDISTDEVPGIVRSDDGTTGGKIFVEVDGTMSVVGWDDIISDINNRQFMHKHTTLILTTTDWINKTQTVSTDFVNAFSTVVVSPSPSSFDDYVVAGIICTEQDVGSLTFTCKTVPITALTVNVLILEDGE